jgi:hypothetical protein
VGFYPFITLLSKVLLMENTKLYQEDLASVRSMMEKSSKFISFSGLSGMLAGLYALLGAGFVYVKISRPSGTLTAETSLPSADITLLLATALAVLAASVLTGYLFSAHKARKHGVSFWTATTRHLLINLSIPLLCGGLFSGILLAKGYFTLIAPVLLIFYGLALLQASTNLYDEIRYLGYSEIFLGLVCTLSPSYSLLLWALGFGVLHMIYGALMYRKYDR